MRNKTVDAAKRNLTMGAQRRRLRFLALEDWVTKRSPDLDGWHCATVLMGKESARLTGADVGTDEMQMRRAKEVQPRMHPNGVHRGGSEHLI